jgi:hypothetical protein
MSLGNFLGTMSLERYELKNEIEKSGDNMQDYKEQNNTFIVNISSLKSLISCAPAHTPTSTQHPHNIHPTSTRTEGRACNTRTGPSTHAQLSTKTMYNCINLHNRFQLRVIKKKEVRMDFPHERFSLAHWEMLRIAK